MYRSHVGPVELHDFIGSYCLDLLIGLGLKNTTKQICKSCGCLLRYQSVYKNCRVSWL